ncbi:MAG: ferredoxin [Candidatus Aenigmarchaeota archaeon]|nr:ferredoxin [Candidatus Aenigmarchaeota archaeon]
MVDYKVVFSKEKCIGCGACADVCPDNWEMENGGGKAKPKKVKISEKECACNKEAEDICPVDAIEIEKID